VPPQSLYHVIEASSPSDRSCAVTKVRAACPYQTNTNINCHASVLYAWKSISCPLFTLQDRHGNDGRSCVRSPILKRMARWWDGGLQLLMPETPGSRGRYHPGVRKAAGEFVVDEIRPVPSGEKLSVTLLSFFLSRVPTVAVESMTLSTHLVLGSGSSRRIQHGGLVESSACNSFTSFCNIVQDSRSNILAYCVGGKFEPGTSGGIVPRRRATESVLNLENFFRRIEEFLIWNRIRGHAQHPPSVFRLGQITTLINSFIGPFRMDPSVFRM